MQAAQLRRTALFAALLAAFALPAAASSGLTAADQSFVDKAIALDNQSLERASVVESSATAKPRTPKWPRCVELGLQKHH